MGKLIRLLDCTLRDGAYITGAEFGGAAIRGIIKKMQDARIDIIECGWLKDGAYKEGTSFFHVPADAGQYLGNRTDDALYCAMIDWDRYDTASLPPHDGRSIDAVRVVFPHGRHKEGIETGKRVRAKGYKVLFQAANTLAYSDKELEELAECMNDFKPVSISVVDTFGAMYFEDLDRIVDIMDRYLDSDIEIGFHAHNNQQLAFALNIRFVEKLGGKRKIIVDAALNGMGRGAGNAATELMAGYLNKNCHGNYDMDAIMDAIDTYMQSFHEKYSWGYSTPYFIAGMYQCHVNNISYLLKNHRTNSRDMRSIIESLSVEERRKYDYDLLENKYIENQGRVVDDAEAMSRIQEKIHGRKVLLLAPGKSTATEYGKINSFITRETPVVIEVNAFNCRYGRDLVFFTNTVRYEYSMAAYPGIFKDSKKILLSNIKALGGEDEWIINFNSVIKRGWEHFDNAVILCLRLMNKLKARDVYIAGFDGFKTKYNESYADESLPTLNPDNKWEELNREIKEMYDDFRASSRDSMNITFLTESIYEEREK